MPALRANLRKKLLILSCITGVVLSGSPGIIHADEAEYRLLGVVEETIGEVTKIVPKDGPVTLTLVCPKIPEEDKKIQLRLSEFLSEDNRQLDVNFVKPDNGALTKTMDITVKTENNIELDVPFLLPGLTYSGTLTLMTKDKRQLHWKVSLLRPAIPMVDLKVVPNNFPKNICLHPFPWWVEKCGEFSVELQNNSKSHPITGITVLREGQASSPSGELDLHNHLDVQFVDSKGNELDVWPLISKNGNKNRNDKLKDNNIEPNIEVGKNAELKFILKDLEAGKYEFTMKVKGENIQESDQHKLKVTLNLKHHIFWAILILLSGIALSFFMTKGISNWRSKISLVRRIDALHVPWLSKLKPIMPVMWLRASRKQCRDLMTKFWWIRAPVSVLDRLKKAELLLKILREYYLLDKVLDNAHLPIMAHYRANNDLKSAISDLDPNTVNEEKYQELYSNFKEVHKWAERTALTYWPIIERHQERLKDEINLNLIAKNAGATTGQHNELNKISNRVWKFTDKDDFSKIAKIDKKFASLEVLWERRHNEDALKALLPMVIDQDVLDLKKLFETADGEDWKDLKKVADRREISIHPNEKSSSVKSLEVLKPICFSLRFKNAESGDKFLVRNRITCVWSFELVPINGKPKITWEEEAIGPQIIQFTPEPGILKVGVIIHYTKNDQPDETKKKHIDDVWLKITEQREYALRSSFAKSEWAMLLGASLIAVLSGLSIKYFSSDTFGSFEDCLTLFLWGGGMDQGKNAIQVLNSYSKEAEAGASQPSGAT